MPSCISSYRVRSCRVRPTRRPPAPKARSASRAQRDHPSVSTGLDHGLVRQTNRALPIADCALAKDAILIICPYALHRRPDLYPEPRSSVPSAFFRDRASIASPTYRSGPDRDLHRHGAALQLAQVIPTSPLSELRFEGEQPDVAPSPANPATPARPAGRVVRRSPAEPSLDSGRLSTSR